MTFSIFILAPLLLGLSIFFAILTRTIYHGRGINAAIKERWTAHRYSSALMVAFAIFSAFNGILSLALTYKWLLTVVTW